MLKFVKNWTLPLAMLVGALGYWVLSVLPVLNPLKPLIVEGVSWFMPCLIFIQLLLTFCKIEPRELLPKVWHGWLLMFQLVSCGLLAWLLLTCPMPDAYRSVAEGAMVCLICPTATAAAVITGKLGGNASTLTTYTLLANLLAAIVVPLVFPLVEPHEGLGFAAAFVRILSRVFPLLLFPFFVALVLRRCFPRVHRALLAYHGMAFYLWAVALAIVTGQTIHSLVASEAEAEVELLVAMAGLAVCVVQFIVGKSIGSAYHDRISAGQALGQKNTVLAIWMAYTYLTPLSSVAPGSYVLWQNIINSWQLWKKRKREARLHPTP